MQRSCKRWETLECPIIYKPSLNMLNGRSSNVKDTLKVSVEETTATIGLLGLSPLNLASLGAKHCQPLLLASTKCCLDNLTISILILIQICGNIHQIARVQQKDFIFYEKRLTKNLMSSLQFFSFNSRKFEPCHDAHIVKLDTIPSILSYRTILWQDLLEDGYT